MTAKQSKYVNDCHNCRFERVCTQEPIINQPYCPYHVHVMMSDDAEQMLEQLREDGFYREITDETRD